MRRFFSVSLLLLLLAAMPAVARPNDPAEGRDGFFDRLVRIVSTFFRLDTKDDLLRPPLP